MPTTHADAVPCATTCTCKAATQARGAWTLGLAFALLILAVVSAIGRHPGGIVLIFAGAYLLQLWHVASPPAAEDWWKRPRTWLGILAVGIGVTALVIGVAG